MSRKTLWEFAAEHAATAMSCWKEAHELAGLRSLNGDAADLADPQDPVNVTEQAEADVEAALQPLFESGRYAIEGHRGGAVERERLHPDTMKRLWFRLALGDCGVTEIDYQGRLINAWNNCVVVELAAAAPAKAETTAPSATPAPTLEIERDDNDAMPADSARAAAWAKPVIDCIVGAGLQLKQSQFTEMILAQPFGRNLQTEEIDQAWTTAKPSSWKRGRVQDRKAIDNWRIYVAKVYSPKNE